MATLVSADWVEERLGSPEVLVLDPRRPVPYLKGHLQNAVNLPAAKAMDPQGGLLPVERLEEWAGAAGLADGRTPVVYDASDGRNAALLAWILEYLGRTDVHFLDSFLERWVAEGREIFYRPVKTAPAMFSARVQGHVRAMLNDVRDAGWKLVDFRSPEEYSGQVDTDGRPGHIPGARHLDWRKLVGRNHQLLAPPEELERLLASTGIGLEDKVVAYCRTGVRAALGYFALQQLGRQVRLYDGSFQEWARSGLPVE